MPDYNKPVTVTLSERQWSQMKQAIDSGKYNTNSQYLRAMLEAGKSNIAALDPRTSDTGMVSQTTHDSPNEAAKALSDAVLIDAIDHGEKNRQDIQLLKNIVNDFESQLANRLDELAAEDTSPVESKRDPHIKYWLEEME